MLHSSKIPSKKNDYRHIRIKRIVVYKTDIQIEYEFMGKRSDNRPEEGKNSITELSRKSLANLAFYAQNTSVKLVGMTTLTYPGEYPKKGKLVKSHLNRLLSWARYRYKPLSYLWFLEFQKRGAPHFHLLTSVDMSADRDVVKERWYDAVGSGDKRHLRAGVRVEKIRSEDGAARYAAKYAAKRDQKLVPEEYGDVGSFWGCSRDIKPVQETSYDARGMTGADLSRFMKSVGWEYHESLTKPLKTLYNAAHLIK